MSALFRTGMKVEWNPRCTPRWVPGEVVEDQSSADGAVLIVLVGNEQRINVIPDQLRMLPHWEGYAWGPVQQLAARLVQAAEDAIEIAADSRSTALSGASSVEGLTVDFARTAVAAALDELADDLARNWHTEEAVKLHALANLARGVPALKPV